MNLNGFSRFNECLLITYGISVPYLFYLHLTGRMVDKLTVMVATVFLKMLCHTSVAR